MANCGRCGAESPPGFRYCGACGAPLQRPRPSRKVVTALFCDVTGSTALGEALDPEALRRVMEGYFAEMRDVIERHGGTVEKFIGDAVMAVFGIPAVHEDDALRAVRAAVEIRDRLPAVAARVGVGLQMRTGVNTGPVLADQGENLAIGDAVNVAARLEQAAAPGEILIGEATMQLVRDAVDAVALEALAVKGKSDPVRAYRVLEVDAAAAGVARRFETPLIGRDRELRVLRDAYDRAVDEGCHLVTVLGPAGVGKSRLAEELLVSVEATVLSGRCLPYGDGITFWPLVEALGDAAPALLEQSAGVPQQLFWAVRRHLEQLAVERPVVLLVDDLQWAEPLLLDLLDHVGDLARDAALLILCLARPELLERRPAWGGGKLNATSLLLRPLAQDDCETVLDAMGEPIEPSVRSRIVATSGGNPLFLAEMAAFARQRGHVAVPPSIEALLAARLEGLPAPERAVLEHGAVEGEVFSRQIVETLMGRSVEENLSALVRKDLIHPQPDGDAYRFRHLLVRDAAYASLPKAVRWDLHERLGAEMDDLDEIAGWHLEQAVRYARELGQEPEATLVRRAAERLAAAGRRAAGRKDSSAARNLLERAMALEADAAVAVDLAEQLLYSGDLRRGEEVLAFAERDPASLAMARLTRMAYLARARPDDAAAYVEAELPAITQALRRSGDDRGLARACMAEFFIQWMRAQPAPCVDLARRAAEHARRAGDGALQADCLSWFVAAIGSGPAHVDTVLDAIDRLAADDPGPFIMAAVTRERGQVALRQGRLDEARALITEATAGYEALGLRKMATGASELGADLALQEGHPEEALTCLRESDAAMEAFGEDGFRSTVQARLAQIHWLLGDLEAARAAVELSERLGGEEDELNFAITHGVRGLLALEAGDAAAADRWSRSGVDHALRTGFVIEQADALLRRAQVLRALGRDAEPDLRRAAEIAAGKGDRVREAAARRLLGEPARA